MVPKIYRIWLEDKVEPNGGIWSYGWVDDENYFREFSKFLDEEEIDTLEQYEEWGYKIEKVELCT